MRTMQLNEKTLWIIFAIIGFITIVGLIYLVAYFTFNALIDIVRNLRWKYKYKHRFDKKPVAKCYCKDCYYHTKNGKCENVTWADRYTPDNGFCYDSNPITAKEDVDYND